MNQMERVESEDEFHRLTHLGIYHSITSLTKAMSNELVSSAHDCSDAGLAAAVAECCFGCDSGS